MNAISEKKTRGHLADITEMNLKAWWG